MQNGTKLLGISIFFLTRTVSCCSLYTWVWGCILKYQFEHMVKSASHFAALDRISTASELCSAVKSHFSISWRLVQWQNWPPEARRYVSCYGSYLRVCAQELIFLFCPVIYLGHNTEWSQMNSISFVTPSVTKNANVKNFNISDGASPGPPE